MARLLAERFAAWGCTPHPVHYAYSEASIARLVAEGLGIGLYLTRQIAEKQGGYVKVESAPGKGSVFSLFLPRP